MTSEKEPTKSNRSRWLAPALIIGGILAILLCWYFFTSTDDSQAVEQAPQSNSVVAGSGGSDSATETATATPSPEKTKTLSADGAQQAPEAQDWRPVARDFATAWADSEGGKDAWLARLKPLTTDEVYKGFENTDEKAIQNLTYSGLAVRLTQGSVKYVNISYEETGDLMQIGLVTQNDGSWKVGFVNEI